MLNITIHLTNVYLLRSLSHLETGTISKCLGYISKQNIGLGGKQLTINININKLSNIFEGAHSEERRKAESRRLVYNLDYGDQERAH